MSIDFKCLPEDEERFSKLGVQLFNDLMEQEGVKVIYSTGKIKEATVMDRQGNLQFFGDWYDGLDKETINEFLKKVQIMLSCALNK